MPESKSDVFAILRTELANNASKFKVTKDSAEAFELWCKEPVNKKPMYFGGVAIKKSYVSLYLMGVYMNPKLLETVPPTLMKRMQGKSCFNFNSVEHIDVEAVSKLIATCIEDYRKQGYL